MMYPVSARSLTMPNALRSVMPTDTAISRSRAPGSRAMHSSTRAWLVRKPQVRMRGNYHIAFPEYHCQFPGSDDAVPPPGTVAPQRWAWTRRIREGDARRSGCRVSPRVVFSLFSTPVLDHRGDVPDAYFKSERVDIV